MPPPQEEGREAGRETGRPVPRVARPINRLGDLKMPLGEGEPNVEPKPGWMSGVPADPWRLHRS